MDHELIIESGVIAPCCRNNFRPIDRRNFIVENARQKFTKRIRAGFQRIKKSTLRYWRSIDRKSPIGFF